MDDDLSGPDGPNREKPADGKPLPKITSNTTLPAEIDRSAEEALAREKALVANLQRARQQIALTVVSAEVGCFWAVWALIQPWLNLADFEWIREISGVAIVDCRHNWSRRASDGSFSLAELLAATNIRVFDRNRVLATLRDLLKAFNVSRKDEAKPRYEVLCRFATVEDRHSYRDCIFNLCGEDVTVVRVRAFRGYSTEITTELLLESRTRVNARYEETAQKHIPVYYLGPDGAGAEGMNCAEHNASAKIEICKPGGLSKNFSLTTPRVHTVRAS